MSFSSEIKERIIKERKKRATDAYILGIVGFGAEIRSECVSFFSENENVIDEINSVICGVRALGKKTDMAKGYKISFYEHYRKILEYASFSADNSISDIEKRYMTAESEKRDFIKGAFVSGGSASNPKKSYHIEFDTKYKEFAELLCHEICSFGINARISERKGRYVVYAKEYEAIADILNIMGAEAAAFELYNIQIEKEMRNDINRRINFETANAEKTAKASTRQVYAIKKLIAAGKFEKLPENLKEIAHLRMEYPEASLKSLGELLAEPIGKSGVNHRLEKIIAIADNID